MRELHFRIWREEIGQMIELSTHDANAMLGTDIFDQRGHEIYEDDIIRHGDKLFIVKYLCGTFYADQLHGNISIPLSDFHMDCEIIEHRRTRK